MRMTASWFRSTRIDRIQVCGAIVRGLMASSPQIVRIALQPVHRPSPPDSAVDRRQPARSRRLTKGPADRVFALDTSGPIQVLCPIVLPQSLLMTADQVQVPESRSVGTELVGRQQFRREALFL